MSVQGYADLKNGGNDSNRKAQGYIGDIVPLTISMWLAQISYLARMAEK